MKKGLFIFCLSLFALAFTACKKNNPDSPNNNITGVYKLTALKMQATGAQQVDIYNQLTECAQNDTWGFHDNGQFLFGGAAGANCADGDYSGTWTLSGKTLTITAQQDSNQYQLLSYDGKNLSLSFSEDFNGVPTTFYGTFTKQ